MIHIGVGGFHRAHQAVYFDDLAQREISSDWGIIGTGVRTGRLGANLSRQGCAYSVVERDGDTARARVVGSIIRYLSGPADPESVLVAMSHPATQLVTLTVTGDGYGLDGEGCFDPSQDEIAGDAAAPAKPVTAPGYLVEALRRRRAQGLEPFTVLSCDNLPENGRAARRAVTGLASAQGHTALSEWIELNVAFPCSVVDRITPGCTDEALTLLRDDFGLTDTCPVVTEPFTQWIIEDAFSASRPPLDEVGAEFVTDVEPFELTKKRLLNGSHCALAYLGTLASYERIDEAMSDPRLVRFTEGFMDEVSPLLPPAPGLDLRDYKRTLIRRFSNPGVGDLLSRLARRGTTKMPAYLLPSLQEALDQGRPCEHLTLAVAAWVSCLRGYDLKGRSLEVEDAKADAVRSMARRAADDPAPLLAEKGIFGSLGGHEDWVDELRRAIRSLDEHGVAGAVRVLAR